MIAVDTSAIIAILYNEPGAEALTEILMADPRPCIGAPTLFEVRLVMGGRQKREGIADADALLAKTGIETVAWTETLADFATDAFLRFGKGQGHPAQLNFGDCMAYALAKALDVPLLYVGDDFARTDIPSALTP